WKILSASVFTGITTLSWHTGGSVREADAHPTATRPPAGGRRCCLLARLAARAAWRRRGSSRERSSRFLSVGDVAPPVHICGVAGGGADVARGGGHEASGLLLLHDVRGPATRAGTGEHRRHHVRRYLREVEDHRRPEFDVRFDGPPRAPLAH